MEVAFVRWPAERARRDELAGLAVPRLLLVEDGHAAPDSGDCLEDWVRVHTPEADVAARVAALARRVDAHPQPSAVVPHLDADGVLRAGGGWVPVPPVEARLLRALLDRYGTVVGRDVLSRAGWDGRAGRNVLDVHVLRLRRRVAPLGLAIRTVRSRGYLLEVDRSRSNPPA